MATKTASKTATKSASKATAATKSATPKATSAGRRKSTDTTTANRTKAAAVAMRSAAAATPKPAPTPTPAAGVAAAASVASAAAASASVTSATGATDVLRRPDLIQAVADRVSLRRAEAKMVFDVVLDEIGKALDANEEVIVPPLGKLMVKKRIEKPNGEMLTLKLKRAAQDPTAGDVAPLAKAAERS